MKALLVLRLVAEQDLAGRRTTAPAARSCRACSGASWRTGAARVAARRAPAAVRRAPPSMPRRWTASWLHSGPLRIGLVDEQQLREVHRRVSEHDAPFDLSHGQIELPGGGAVARRAGRRREAFLQGGQCRQGVPMSGHRGWLAGRRQLASPDEFLAGPGGERLVHRLDGQSVRAPPSLPPSSAFSSGASGGSPP